MSTVSNSDRAADVPCVLHDRRKRTFVLADLRRAYLSTTAYYSQAIAANIAAALSMAE